MRQCEVDIFQQSEMEGGTYASCLDRSTNLTLAEMFQPAVLFD